MKRFSLCILLAACSVITAFAASPKLACEALFSDKYKRHKDTEMTINRSADNYFRQLRVDGNAQIVAEIERAVNKDSQAAFNSTQRFNNDGETIILNIQRGDYLINIGFNKYSDSSAKIFLQSQPEAFQ